MKNKLVTLLFAVLSVSLLNAQLVVGTGQNAQQYAQQLVGSGVTISNAVFHGGNGSPGGRVQQTGGYDFNATIYQIGGFSNGNSTNIGIDDGLILSTGNAPDIQYVDGTQYGQYPSGYPSYTVSQDNDPDLESLSPGQSFNCAILEFDFVPDGNQISFSYVFASTEYPGWVDSDYNDVFGFFLSGPGINGPYSNNSVNIATLPSSNTPVSINTVNGGSGSASGCPNGNGTNMQYYVDNCASGAIVPFRGFTVVLDAEHEVECGETYHIKIAIGDIEDVNWDSAVLLKKNSFTSPGETGELGIETGDGQTGTVTICPGESVDLNATVTGVSGGTIEWTPGLENTSSITVSPTTTTTYTATYNYTSQGGGCNGGSSSETLTDVITVVVLPEPTATATANGPVCEGESITLGATGGSTYSWTGPNGFTSSAQNPTLPNSTAGDAGTYTVTVTNADGCSDEATVAVTVEEKITPDFLTFIEICKGETIETIPTTIGGITGTWSPAPNNQETTVYTFTPNPGQCANEITFTIVVNPEPAAVATANTPVCDGETITLGATGGLTYDWTGPNGFTSTAQNPTIPNSTSGDAGTYTVTVTNADGCPGEATVAVTIEEKVTPDFLTFIEICKGETIDPIPTTIDGITGTWSPAPNNQETTVYTFTPDPTECANEITFTIVVNPLPTPAILGNNEYCEGSTSTLDAGAGYASYTWSNGETSQTIEASGADSPYTVTVTTDEGCTATSDSFNIEEKPTVTTTNVFEICDGETVLVHGVSVSLAGEYTEVFTGNNGCDSTSVVNVIVEPKLVPNFSPVAEICDGETLSSLPTTSLNGVTGTWSPALNNEQTTTYTFTPATGQCAEDASMTIIVNSNPVLSSNTTNPSCGIADGEIVLTATDGDSPYTYSLGGNNQGANGTFTNLEAGSFTALVTDDNGCSSTLVISLSNEDGPGITSQTTENPSCFGEEDGEITLTVSGGTGNLTYEWTDSFGTVVGNSNVLTDVGNGVYQVTVTDENGCTTSGSYTLSEPALVNAAFNLTDYCEGGSNQATITGLTGGTFVFNPAVTDGATINPTTGEITGGIAGTDYAVEYTVTDLEGCSNASLETVTVNALPEAVITGNDEYCEGSTASLDAGAGFASYNWSNGETSQTVEVTENDTPITVTVTNADGCEATSSEFIVTENSTITTNTTLAICFGQTIEIHGVEQSVANIYEESFTSTTGCDSTSVVTLVVNDLPEPIISGATEYCSGTTVTLDAGTGYDSYNWSNGETSQTVEVTEGDTPVSVTVTDANGCEATSSDFTVTEESEITVNLALEICFGESIVIHGNTETEAGVYQETFMSTGGCDSTSVVTLTVNTLPEAEITGDNEYCEGTTSTLDAGAGYASYEWSNGETTQTIEATENDAPISVIVTDANGCTAVSTNFVVTELPTVNTITEMEICQGETIMIHGVETGEAGSYDEVFTGANACDSIATIILTVNELPTPEITGTATYCAGESTTLGVGEEFTTYDWSNGSTDATIDVTAEDNPITVTVINNNGCSGTSEVINVIELEPIVTTDDWTICQGETIEIHGNEVSEAGTYEELFVSADGCDSTAVVNLVVNPLPELPNVASTELFECMGADLLVELEEPNADLTYTWYFNDEVVGEGTSYGLDYVDGAHSGIYTVVSTNEFGCSSELEILVKIDVCDIVIYEAISPNGDGINDYFFVENLDAYPNSKVWIYNRWGALVYQNDNYKNDWDGTSQNSMNIGGDILPEGTYYYILELGGVEAQPNAGEIYKGFVYIKR